MATRGLICNLFDDDGIRWKPSRRMGTSAVERPARFPSEQMAPVVTSRSDQGTSPLGQLHIG